MKIVSVNQMRLLDRQAIISGIPGEELMERAGSGAVEHLIEWLDRLPERHRQRITILAGKGNNGGDAYVAARLLARPNRPCPVVYSVCPVSELEGDARLNAERLPDTVPLLVCPDKLPAAALAPGSVIIDGLLGTGFRGQLRSPYKDYIQQVNQADRPVAALDLPSGLDGDTGEALGDLAVQADLTITMGLPKKGLFTCSGRPFCGRLRHVDIGLPRDAVAVAESAGEADFCSDITPLFKRRPVNSHKYTFGHTLVIAGSSRYVGAPALVAQGALRSGTGLVTVAVPKGLWTATPGPGPLPAALLQAPVAGHSSIFFDLTSGPEIKLLLKQASAVVIGPGIGTREETATVLNEVLKMALPTVIDADGLNLIAGAPRHFRPLLQGQIMTPHPGEMRRLLTAFNLPDLIGAPRPDQALSLARVTGAVVVLKGSATVTASPSGCYRINSSGSSSLATAGSGDVLAGLLAGFIAQGMDTYSAARSAVFCHGLAAELQNHGERALTADDLPPAIGPALKYITPFG